MVSGNASSAQADGTVLRRTLDEAIRRVESREARTLIPRRQGLKKIIPELIFHEYPELFIQYAGTNRFTLPHEDIDAGPGSIVLISPELPHGERAMPDGDGFGHLVITPEQSALRCHLAEARALGDRPGMVPVISYYERPDDDPPTEIRRLFAALIGEAAFDDDFAPDVIRGLLLALLSSVRRSLEQPPAPRQDHPAVEEVRRIVLSRYNYRDLSVRSLARQLDRSADYLSWLFHEHSGTTLSRYITGVRLDRAADMLRGTEYNISEIAWNCGFSSPAYFSRVFASAFGRSPRDFRRRTRAGTGGP
jgi:AraC-like DNA-binding protein